MIDQIELGRRVRSIREAWGFTVDRAAVFIGLLPDRLEAIEAGREFIKSVDLVRLAYAYGRGPEDLFAEPFDETGPLAEFNWSDLAAMDHAARERLLEHLALARELASLERLLGYGKFDWLAPTGPSVAEHVASDVEEDGLRRRLVTHGIEAYQRGVITLGKLAQLGELARVPQLKLDELLADLAAEFEGPVPPEIPPALLAAVKRAQ